MALQKVPFTKPKNVQIPVCPYKNTLHNSYGWPSTVSCLRYAHLVDNKWRGRGMEDWKELRRSGVLLWWPRPVREVAHALFHNVSVRWKGRVDINQTLNRADPREMSFAELVHFPTKQTPFLFLFHLLSSGLCWVTVHSERQGLNTHTGWEKWRQTSVCVILHKIRSQFRLHWSPQLFKKWTEMLSRAAWGKCY